MVKCPYCGSTAQVKLNKIAVLSDNEQYITLGCDCGCGCEFTVDYAVGDYEQCDIVYIENKK